MEYITNYFNNQSVTKVKNEGPHSYYISHVENSPSTIFIVITPKDSNPFYQPIEMSKLNIQEIHHTPNKNNWSEVKTRLSLKRCKQFIIKDMWCSNIDKKPFQNKIIFRLNDSNLLIEVCVKNKDTSIYFTKELPLLQLLEDFHYKVHTTPLFA